MSFKKWLHQEGYKQPQEMINDLLFEGHTSEEAYEILDDLKDKYSDFCDENDIEIDYSDY
jgi:Fe2+ or Zn2+ uptake regulation protein